MNFRTIYGIFVAIQLTVVAPLPVLAQRAPEAIRLTHVHGLFYSADGTRLKIPSHRGIAVLESGRWTRAPGEQWDFAGFSAAQNVWFASAHPGLASVASFSPDLKRSTDGGKTWQAIGLGGKSAFIHLAAGYRNAAVYLFAPSSTERLPQAGLYRSFDLGAQWHLVPAQGLSGEITRMAVHPDDPAVVVVSTSDGLYLSQDSAATFARLQAGQRIHAVAVSPLGDSVWYGAYSKRARLVVKSLPLGLADREFPLPAMHGDAVAFIAFNPVKKGEMAIATIRRNVFVSRNAGKDWMQVVREGNTNV